MAIPSSAIGEIHTGGSDTTNGGWFDPGQTVGMAADGAATVATTASPVFTSASYTFVAGDVGAYLYISPTANWIAGWYKIASVAGGAATLSAAAGAAELKTGGLTTVAGCAIVASPTGATWAIDYSQQDAAQFTYTDLHGVGASFDLTSAAKPFTVAMVGNFLRVTGGTGFAAGIYYITTVVAGTATFGPGQPHTGAGDNADGTGGMGGAFATPGMAGSELLAGNKLWLKYNATAVTATSTTSNVASGRFTGPTGTVTAPVVFQGYETVRGDQTANRPTFQWAANGGTNYLVTLAAFNTVSNIIFDGVTASFTGRGISLSGGGHRVYRAKVMRFRDIPFQSGNGSIVIEDSEFTGNAAAAGTISLATLVNHEFTGLYVHDNSGPGITISTGRVHVSQCIFDTNTGAGISSTGASEVGVSNCTFYANTGAGIDFTAQPNRGEIINCAFEANGDHGIKMAAAYSSIRTINCAFFNNTTAKYTGITTVLPYGHLNGYNVVGEIVATASMFTNAAGADFSPNGTAGGGILIKGTGYPQTFPGLATPANKMDVGAYSLGVGGFPPIIGN